MSSESGCQVALRWMDVGSFHARLFGIVYLWEKCYGDPQYKYLLHLQNEDAQTLMGLNFNCSLLLLLLLLKVRRCLCLSITTR
jgi:hypothetical protein